MELRSVDILVGCVRLTCCELCGRELCCGPACAYVGPHRFCSCLCFAPALQSCAFALAFPVAVYNLSLWHLRCFASYLIVVLAAGLLFSGRARSFRRSFVSCSFCIWWKLFWWLALRTITFSGGKQTILTLFLCLFCHVSLPSILLLNVGVWH